MRLWLVLLLLVPSAWAGTPEDPEIQDAAGDATQDGADLLAAWLVPTPSGADLHVTTAQPPGDVPLDFDITWDATAPYGDAVPRGVRIHAADDVTAYLLVVYRGGLDEWDELEVVVDPGPPAHWLVSDVPVAPGAGATLEGFAAASYAVPERSLPTGVLGEPDRVPDDDAVGDAALQLPSALPWAEAPWPVAGGTHVVMDEDPGRPAVADLLDFRLRSNGTGVDVQWQVRGLTEDAIAACDKWAVGAFVDGVDGGEGQSLSLDVAYEVDAGYLVPSFLHGARHNEWVDHDLRPATELAYSVRMVAGEPGLIQMHVPDAMWHGDPEGAQPRVNAKCGSDSDRFIDEPSIFGVTGDAGPMGWIMGLPFIIAGVALLVFYRRIQ